MPGIRKNDGDAWAPAPKPGGGSGALFGLGAGNCDAAIASEAIAGIWRMISAYARAPRRRDVAALCLRDDVERDRADHAEGT